MGHQVRPAETERKEKMRLGTAKVVALGGILAALAAVIMCLGGLIPVATFVCPLLCLVVLYLVCHLFGKRIGWAWYGAVSVLSLLLGPDKEAAAVFACVAVIPTILGTVTVFSPVSSV